MLLTLARPTVRERRLHRQTGERAFTLIELLTVIGIIAILSAITFGVVKGIQERAAIGQAKTELSVLATALEAYKGQYGDYPQTGGATDAGASTTTAIATTHMQAKLFNALVGNLGPTLVVMTNRGRSFVDTTNFTLENSNLPTGTAGAEVANDFMDPWGRRYMYYYKAAGSATWTNPGYVLFSTGPNGVSGITVSTGASGTGVVTTSSAVNAADNIYANQ